MFQIRAPACPSSPVEDGGDGLNEAGGSGRTFATDLIKGAIIATSHDDFSGFDLRVFDSSPAASFQG